MIKNLFFFYTRKFLLFKECLEFFIEHHVNLNSKDDQGFAALHYAALKNNFMATHLLIKYNQTILDVIFI